MTFSQYSHTDHSLWFIGYLTLISQKLNFSWWLFAFLWLNFDPPWFGWFSLFFSGSCCGRSCGCDLGRCIGCGNFTNWCLPMFPFAWSCNLNGAEHFDTRTSSSVNSFVIITCRLTDFLFGTNRTFNITIPRACYTIAW